MVPSVKAFPEIALKECNKITTSSTLNNTAIKAVSTDSLKNCRTYCFFVEPVTLRMPISFALRADLAVVRFI